MESKVVSAISGASMPKFLQNMGAVTGLQPPPLERTRIIIFGAPGCGKSTLLNSFPGMLVLDPERGGNTVAEPRAWRWTAPDATPLERLDLAYVEAIDKIIEQRRQGDTSVKMIGLDTLDALVRMGLDAYCIRRGVDDPLSSGEGRSGNGYTLVRRAFYGALERAYAAGLGYVMLVHKLEFIMETDKKARKETQLGVTRSFRGHLLQMCDYMFYMYRYLKKGRTVPGTGTPILDPKTGKAILGRDGKPIEQNAQKAPDKEVRVLMTTPGETRGDGDSVYTNDVKTRVPLPETIVIPQIGGYETLASAYNEAVKKLTQGKA